jgi:hypothetical protein
MDKLARYREIIRQLIFEYATHKPAIPLLSLSEYSESKD